MNENDLLEKEDIFSKVLRAGRRTYFFDVRSTKAGDYYLTITESKKFTNDDGSFHYKKHKIYLYKEDFEGFRDLFDEMTDFIVKEKGQEVISERHQRNFHKPNGFQPGEGLTLENNGSRDALTKDFTDLSFEDI